jgi:hypothetical protein
MRRRRSSFYNNSSEQRFPLIESQPENFQNNNSNGNERVINTYPDARSR